MKSGSGGDALDKLLADRPGDEKTGAHASLGFAYQHWWGALVAVELLLAEEEDFAVGMEVKEDVVLLDSATSPTKVEFCQVKKNETAGGWSLKQLHRKGRKKADGTHELSPLSKLYRRRHEFQGHPTKLRFVSNVAVKIPAANDAEETATDRLLHTLDPKHAEPLRTDIAEQVGLDAVDVELTDFRLHRTHLPVHQQHAFIAGKIAELCEAGVLPYAIENLTVAARMLASELQTRANSTDYAKTFVELQARLMSRADVLKTLAAVAQSKQPRVTQVFDEAVARLDAEHHSFRSVRMIKAERISVLTSAVDRADLAFRKAAQALSDAEKALGELPDLLGRAMEAVVHRARSDHSATFEAMSEGYINGICLLVLNDGIDINVLHIAVGPEPEGKK